MINTDKIIIASHNEGKIKEFRKLFSKYNIEVLSANDTNLPDVEETGKTFAENAIIKASESAKFIGVPVIAEDSGLCVDTLDGRPGVYTARYAIDETGNRNMHFGMQKLLDELGDNSNRNAHFACVICLCYPDGKYETFEGKVEGKIAQKITGENGFGYDPVFIPNGYKKTFGELDVNIKHKFSHRANALKKLAEKYFA